MTTFEKVQAMFAEQLGINDLSKITMESDIIADLEADSLDIFILLSNFDKEFGTSISDEDAMKLKTIGDIVAYVDAHKAE